MGFRIHRPLQFLLAVHRTYTLSCSADSPAMLRSRPAGVPAAADTGHPPPILFAVLMPDRQHPSSMIDDGGDGGIIVALAGARLDAAEIIY